MTITDGMMAFTMSKHKLLTQYADKFMPLISCMCLRFFSLSFRMKLTTAAGIKAKPMATTKTMNTPLAAAALYLNFYVIGKDDVVTWNLKLLLLLACLRMASYMNCG